MKRDEFIKFISDKTCYRQEVGWLSKCTSDLTAYIPHDGFFLESKYKLGQYKDYEKCFNHSVIERNGKPFNKSIYDLPRWKITIGKTGLYFVTKIKK